MRRFLFFTFVFLLIVTAGFGVSSLLKKDKIEPVNPMLLNFLSKSGENTNPDDEYNIKKVRQSFSELSSGYGPEKQDVSLVANTSLTGRDGNKINLRIYSNNESVAMPILIYYHGGGLCSGNVNDYDTIMRKIAIQNNVVVVGVEYRLAPEHPYPAGFNDSLDVLNNIHKVLKNAKVMADSQIIIMGDSGGGAICATLIAYMAQGKVKVPIEGMILAYPSVDFTMKQKSYKKYGKNLLLTREKVAWYMQNVLGDKIDRRAVSPLYEELPSKNMLPKTLILAAQLDPLVDEGAFYARKLKQAGGNVTYIQFPGLLHAFLNLEKIIPQQVGKAYEFIHVFIKTNFSHSTQP